MAPQPPVRSHLRASLHHRHSHITIINVYVLLYSQQIYTYCVYIAALYSAVTQTTRTAHVWTPSDDLQKMLCTSYTSCATLPDT